MLTGRISVPIVAICIGASTPIVRADETDNDDKAQRLLERIVKEWHYPNTESDVGGGTYSIRTSIQRCTDTYETVWKHYVRKCGFDFKYKATKFYRVTRKDEDAVFVWDDRHKFVDAVPHRIQTFFVCNADDYSVTGIVDPQEGAAAPIIYMTITVRPTANMQSLPPDDAVGASGESPR